MEKNKDKGRSARIKGGVSSKALPLGDLSRWTTGVDNGIINIVI